MKDKLYDALQLMSCRSDVLQDTHGNVSCRVEDSIDNPDSIYIKPSGVPYDSIRLEDICRLDYGYYGRPWLNTSRLTPSVDSIHHIAIYKKYPHVKAICHTHSPYAVAYAALGGTIACYLTEQADYFGHDIISLPYSDLNSWGENIKLRKVDKAVLLKNHGVLTFADDPVKAVNLAIALENIAKKNYLIDAIRISANISSSPILLQSEIDKWHTRYNTVYGQK